VSDRPTERSVFGALADPTRRQVMSLLAGGGPASATQLASGLSVTRQAVAKHLVALQEAGLVESERHGRERRFRLTPAPLSQAVTWMADIGAQWDERLESLTRFLRSS
jgi:DNA-binding transcriptional ArsR family regulator